MGNRLTEAKTVSGTTTNTTWTYPTTSNLLTNVKQGTTTTRAFVYDAAGDTTQDTRASTAYNYTIDNSGRISQLKLGTTVTANYTYDAKDRLSVRQTLNMTPAGTTQYVYDIWDHVIAETNGSGTVVKQYIWIGDLPVGVLDGSSTPATPTLLFVHADHLKRPELMTNASGAVVWKAVYEPFGAVSTITGTASNTYRFPGQWFQLEAGLHYNWHRHYDPTLGRYTSPDPLGVAAGPNVFGYAGQSPLMATDKRGLDNPGLGPYGCWAAAGSCAPPLTLIAMCPPGLLLSPFWPSDGTDGGGSGGGGGGGGGDGSGGNGGSGADSGGSGGNNGAGPHAPDGTPMDLVATNKRSLPNIKCDGPNSDCAMGTPGQFPDPTQPGKLLCWDCYVKTFGRPK